MDKLTVNAQTKLQDLQKFTADMGDSSKLRATYDKKTDTYTLYSSSKGKGTGLKNYLFGTVTKRRNNAESAIAKILFNTPRVDQFKGNLSALNIAFNSANIEMGRHVDVKGMHLKEIVGDASRAFVQALLPQGVVVDSNGVLRGAVEIKSKNVPGQGQVPVKAAIQDGVDKRLQNLSKKTFQDVGGIQVHQEFLDDAVRMNFNVGGQKTNVHNVSSTQGRNQANLQLAQDLKAFCGTDNATKVLSAACHQGLFNNFVSTLNKGDGEPIKFGQPPKGAKPLDYFYTDGNGTTTQIDEPTQYSGVNVNLEKVDPNDPNSDFKMTVDWDVFVSRIVDSNQTSHDLLPAKEGHVVKTNTTCEIRISKSEADKGNFVWQFIQKPVVAFEGTIS